MSIRSNLSTSLEYDLRAGRYRDIRSGQFVSQQTVRRELDKVLDKAERQAREVTQQLQQRRITVAQWERQMAESIRRTHTASAALAKGGWGQMDSRAWGATGSKVRSQLAYLDRFAEQIQNGSIPLDGRIRTRAESYVKSGRVYFEEESRVQDRFRGYQSERNIRHGSDSCTGCIEAEGLGWQPIGTITLPGSRQCLSNCRCTLIRR